MGVSHVFCLTVPIVTCRRYLAKEIKKGEAEGEEKKKKNRNEMRGKKKEREKRKKEEKDSMTV